MKHYEEPTLKVLYLKAESVLNASSLLAGDNDGDDIFAVLGGTGI